MASIPEANLDVRRYVEPTCVWSRPKSIEASERVRGHVDWLHCRSTAPGIALVKVLDFDFLNVSGVGQHDLGKVCCRWGGVDRSSKSVLHQLRQKPAVVDMGVAEHDSGDFIGRERKWAVVEFFLGFRALEQTTVDQNLSVFSFKPEA